MPANLENSAVTTVLEKVSFHFNPKGQCQRMFKLPHNCTHFTCWKGNAQNSSSQASLVYEPRTYRYTNWIQKKQRNQRSNCPHPLDNRKSKIIPKKNKSTSASTMLELLTVWITTNWKILKEMGVPDHLTCLWRNLYATQGSNSQNWTWNNRLIQNWESSTSRL